MITRHLKHLVALRRTVGQNAYVVAATASLGVLASIAEGFSIALFIPILNGINAEAGGTSIPALQRAVETLIPQGDPESRMLLLSGLLFVGICGKALLGYGANVALTWLSTAEHERLRVAVFDRILNAPLDGRRTISHGDMLNVITAELWRTTQALNAVVRALITVGGIVVFATLLFLIDGTLTLLVLGITGLIYLVVRVITRRVEPLSEQLTWWNGHLSERLTQTLRGRTLIHAYGRRAVEQEQFTEAARSLKRLSRRMTVLSEAVSPMYEMLAAGLLIVIIFWNAGSTNISALITFVIVLYRLQPRIRQLDQIVVSIRGLSGSVERVSQVLQPGLKRKPLGLPEHPSIPENPSRRTKVSPPEIIEDIRLDDVTYQYPNADQPALREVSLRIPVCATTAIVGPSGAGKTTILNILTKLIVPDIGDITIDGTDLSEIDTNAWRRGISIVMQETILFNMSVWENITYGKPKASPEDVVRAARRACVHSVIEGLPDGYDTVLGEDGSRLSSGERQRISLARAFVREPRILLLDEATNAIDLYTENKIRLRDPERDETVVLIAHRQSTVDRADHVVYLHEGRVAPTTASSH